MKRRPVFLVFSLIGLSAIAIALATSAGAASRDEQKKACRGDAIHFCKADIPNREKIIACLKQHLSELKPACQAMFNEDNDKGASQPDDAASQGGSSVDHRDRSTSEGARISEHAGRAPIEATGINTSASVLQLTGERCHAGRA